LQSIRITGRGIYLPKLVHTNETLPPLERAPTPEQLARLGVRTRHWAGPDEGVAEMAAWAAERALAQAGALASEIDLLILSNWTARSYIPELAPKVQELLGAKRAFAFDLSTACAGFVNGVAISHHFLQNPRYERALIVASETLSRRAKPGSRATLVYGDAAAAWVVERGSSGSEILDYELFTDGDHHGDMGVDESGYVETHVPQIELNALAAQSFTKACRRVLDRNRLSIADVSFIVPHSGTEGIQATFIKTLEVPPEKVLSNFRDVGNVSSAAIPVSLEHYLARGEIKPGDLILSPTAGTGWYYAALLYRA